MERFWYNLAALFRQRDAFTLVLTVKGPEGPLNTQDKAGRPVAAGGHYPEDIMAPYQPPGISREVSRTSSPAQAQQRVYDCRRY